MDLTFWRGTTVPTGGVLDFYIEQSTDREQWESVFTANNPTADTEIRIDTGITKAWLRARIDLNSDFVVTCWLTGFLVGRGHSS